jgi:hypothetical protein
MVIILVHLLYQTILYFLHHTHNTLWHYPIRVENIRSPCAWLPLVFGKFIRSYLRSSPDNNSALIYVEMGPVRPPWVTVWEHTVEGTLLCIWLLKISIIHQMLLAWSNQGGRQSERVKGIFINVILSGVRLTREWSDPTCRNLPWFFFFFLLQEYTQQNPLSKF